ncbi:MAG TPA: c-type cytochrome [Bryobacteraceae bacterium]|nr:c-type cytochrome [Bryobacteraceae bacterium]
MIWVALLLAHSAAETGSAARGEQVFAQSCSVGYCHGKAGAASRGPRLRGRTFARSYLERVIRDGIPNSAMPGWKGRLTDQDIAAVIDYVASLATVSNDPPPTTAGSAPAGPAPAPEFRGTAEAERGFRLFFDATRETRCGVCHVSGGRGIAIGPDLGNLAGKPEGEIAAVLRSPRARHVVTVRLRGGETFPGLRVSKQGSLVKFYDLTTPPPVLRTVSQAEVLSVSDDAAWRHDAYLAPYTPSEIDDLAAYLRARRP